ncbi:6,7-dimethyl-8-ribityllumazine synthase [Polluticaenibacter yanchengensis]|uniref:6,7-dimethyl-8-ribityllumazine synthase n=1 Tax=Polluticaenibacter yanchengensis TaxID=3014562 RepID=A0ABT4UKC5_9BACT|nr:6,7-dimethyl-8-ribityllumazine synthase [Chitinophagaceae bacterium LY-5]
MASKGNEKLVNTEFEGLDAIDEVVIVKTEWNAHIINEMEAGCKRVLESAGVKNISVITVPGAVELPFAIQAYERRSAFEADAFIALGCVIKGDTPHFDYVCQSVTQGITTLNTQLDVPVIFGVLTVNTEAQAFERLGGVHGHKGEEAAITALKMVVLCRALDATNIAE